MALKSKSIDIGGGYRILTEYTNNSCGEWIEHRLFKGAHNLAWCIMPRGQSGRADVWRCHDNAEAYREYLRSGFARYPFI